MPLRDTAWCGIDESGITGYKYKQKRRAFHRVPTPEPPGPNAWAFTVHSPHLPAFPCHPRPPNKEAPVKLWRASNPQEEWGREESPLEQFRADRVWASPQSQMVRERRSSAIGWHHRWHHPGTTLSLEPSRQPLSRHKCSGGCQPPVPGSSFLLCLSKWRGSVSIISQTKQIQETFDSRGQEQSDLSPAEGGTSPGEDCG